MRRAVAAVLLLVGLLGTAPLALAQAAPCQFVLGFATLASLIPQQVGQCVTDQAYAANGDALQQTTGGLLVWRKTDNWTAFTDGYRTWINGPTGLQERLNSQRFSWEPNPQGLPLADAGATPTGWKTFSGTGGLTLAYPPDWQAAASSGPSLDLQGTTYSVMLMGPQGDVHISWGDVGGAGGGCGDPPNEQVSLALHAGPIPACHLANNDGTDNWWLGMAAYPSGSFYLESAKTVAPGGPAYRNTLVTILSTVTLPGE